MPGNEQDDIANLQGDVQRLLGRCLVRLQQFERLLKAMVATQEISGTLQSLQHALDARRMEVSDKTLGIMIGRLMDSCIRPEGDDQVEVTQNSGVESLHFGFKMQLSLPKADHEKLMGELRELVSLRNTLVHHFIEQFDLHTVGGCSAAKASLIRSYEEIDRHFARLRSFAGHMDDAKRSASEFMRSAEFHELVVNGIDPDGKIHWPMAGIVTALREAFHELAVDGWVSVDAAARWVSENRPDQTPQKYGCSRWRHVVHESREFELRRFVHMGQFGAWFRIRPD